MPAVPAVPVAAVTETIQVDNAPRQIDTAPTDLCKFLPWGPNKEACVNRCVNPEDRYLWGGEECTLSKCQDICNKCNTTRCLWVPQYVDTEDRCNAFVSKTACNYQEGCSWDPYNLKCNSVPEVEERLTPAHPPKQLISVIPVSNKLTIVWKSKEHDLYPNTGFLVRYFKTFKPFEGLKLQYVEKNENNKYNIELTNLDNEEYSISVTSINEIGLGEQSNIVRIKPDKS